MLLHQGTGTCMHSAPQSHLRYRSPPRWTPPATHVAIDGWTDDPLGKPTGQWKFSILMHLSDGFPREYVCSSASIAACNLGILAAPVIRWLCSNIFRFTLPDPCLPEQLRGNEFVASILLCLAGFQFQGNSANEFFLLLGKLRHYQVPLRDAVRHTTEGDHAQLWFGLEDCGWYIFEVPSTQIISKQGTTNYLQPNIRRASSNQGYRWYTNAQKCVYLEWV